MIDRSNKRPRTMLEIPIEPLSYEDHQKVAAKWAEKTLMDLVAYANAEPSFRSLLCDTVVKSFGSDDQLSRLMIKCLDVARKGKSRGPKRKWTESRYRSMLIHYEVRCKLFGRQDALEWIAHNEGVGIHGEQDCNIKKVEEKITEARKKVPEWRDLLPDFIKNSN
ncbi:hypothetical protein [Nitrosomonas sp.]|uniref:hypothetical protein n=1 Tax=Nitrosomonas sp. TaxID=42353 RepID=UPI0026160565|nr:hypothetical protein [Nitrosomonas sp.]MCW5600164.1 hypothetical protein [Nitrosomonas sp.]